MARKAADRLGGAVVLGDVRRLPLRDEEVEVLRCAHPRPSAVAGLTGEAARTPAETGVREPGGWTRAVFPIESEDRALADFLALGTEAEVVEPQALRSRLAATARAVAERHDAP